mgnify:CR=1 FL=1
MGWMGRVDRPGSSPPPYCQAKGSKGVEGVDIRSLPTPPRSYPSNALLFSICLPFGPLQTLVPSKPSKPSIFGILKPLKHKYRALNINI